MKKHIINTLTQQLGHQPTTGQKSLINIIPDFIMNDGFSEILLVKGFAGTGKTSVIGALAKTMKIFNNKLILLAPTGRAAKVLSSYCSHPASTIHKKIYRQKSASDVTARFILDRNLHRDTLFIVDEASMISNNQTDQEIFGTGRLLDDLITYINNQKNCKLILVGDTAQLPPVHLDISPALDKGFLGGFGFDVKEIFLDEVLRQAEDSGILFNASNIRHQITDNIAGYPHVLLEDFSDIFRINGADLIERITEAYDNEGPEETIVITRSNKTANQYNKGIRNSILNRDDELSAGDLLMVVKNNYFWMAENETTDFIANGDVIEIVKVKRYQEMYGFRFADVVVKFCDYRDMELEVKLLLDTIFSETASLSGEQNKTFFYTVMEDYLDIPNKQNRLKQIRNNPWFNALQVKFAYAVTCHKSQGGQWKNVFIDQGYLRDEMINKEYLRWLYTAFTRSTDSLFLVNFNEKYFE